MNPDMSEMIKNFGQMMNNKNMSSDMQKMFNNMSGANGFNHSNNSNKPNNSNAKSSYNKKNSYTNNNNFENTANSSIFENMNTDNTNNINNIFGNIDMETIMKMQKIMSSMNSKEPDSRTNLLMSLKPYLKESRRNKVDQYVQLLKMEKIFEVINPLGR